MAVKDVVKKRIRHFGRKNAFCRVLAIPVLVLSITVIDFCSMLGSNKKRISFAVLSLLMVGVFSSFSLPVFSNNEDISINIFELDNSNDFVLENFEEEYDSFTFSSDDENNVIDEELDVATFIDADLFISTGKDISIGENDIDENLDYFSKDDWRLILVNKEHFIPTDYEVPLGTISGTMQCDERILEDLSHMLAAAKEDGINLIIASPYRSYDRQVMLFERDVDKYLKKGMSYLASYKAASFAVTVPGTSEHQIGLAMDIISSDYKSLTEGFAKTSAGMWLEANSVKYGFTLRYPKGKEEITGIEFEPWHFRYVGSKAANFMKDNNICLEELWEDYVR